MFKVLYWLGSSAIKQKFPRSRGLPLLASQTVKSLKLVFVKLPFRHTCIDFRTICADSALCPCHARGLLKSSHGGRVVTLVVTYREVSAFIARHHLKCPRTRTQESRLFQILYRFLHAPQRHG